MSAAEGDIIAAGEYALGLMTAEGAAAFSARLSREPLLRAAVALWQEDLAAAAADLPDVAPPARVKVLLDAGLAPPRRRALGWIGGLLAGGLAGLGATALLLPEVPPVLVADLSGDGIRAHAHLRGHRLEVELAAAVPEGRDFELWWIVGQAAPVSLGVLPPGARRIRLAPDLQPAPGIVLAISDEPAGGSPTGLPTGAVLAAGPLAAI